MNANVELYDELTEAIVDAVYGVGERNEPCVEGHFDCATSYHGRCANEHVATALCRIEARVEEIIDAKVQKALPRCAAYRHAENAEEAAEAESEIERQVEWDVLHGAIAQIRRHGV